VTNEVFFDTSVLIQGLIELGPEGHAAQTFEFPEPLRKTFFHDAVRDRAAGGRIYDAHIAAIARAGRARVVVTENVRHFAALERDGVRVVSASDFVEKG
jgi:predicted nucleic acid-binding protein